MNRDLLSRRGLLGAVACSAAALPAAGLGRAQAAPAARHTFNLGLASYSLRKLSLEQTIAACQEAGIRHLSIKDVHLPLGDPPEKLREAVSKIEAAGISLRGGGVFYFRGKDKQPLAGTIEASVRRVFEYAKTCKLPLLVVAPTLEDLDALEAMAKEYDLPVAIHNHGPGDVFPRPEDVLAQIRKRDTRVGVCMDVGHTVRAGGDPIKSARACGARLLDLHVKDMHAEGAEQKQVVLGRGAVDLAGLLRTLQAMKFRGHLALEHEIDNQNPLGGIRESMGYLRGVAAGLGAAAT